MNPLPPRLSSLLAAAATRFAAVCASLTVGVFCHVAAISNRVWAQDAADHPNDESSQFEPRRIDLGATSSEVIRGMQGPPDAKLANDIWIYWNFRPALRGELQKFDTLIVFFARDRVYKYRLVERKPLLQLLADIRKTPNPREPEMVSEVPVLRLETEPESAPRRIGRGMTPGDVVRAMHGKPDATISPEMWVYWNFHFSADTATWTFDTLVVLFTDGRVAKYRLVERKTIEGLLGPAKA